LQFIPPDLFVCITAATVDVVSYGLLCLCL